MFAKCFYNEIKNTKQKHNANLNTTHYTVQCTVQDFETTLVYFQSGH